MRNEERVHTRLRVSGGHVIDGLHLTLFQLTSNTVGRAFISPQRGR